MKLIFAFISFWFLSLELKLSYNKYTDGLIHGQMDAWNNLDMEVLGFSILYILAMTTHLDTRSASGEPLCLYFIYQSE